MATSSGLVRSFYGWLARVERSLREDGNVLHSQLLPVQRPTSIGPVTRLALHTVRALSETVYEDKARYWADVFSRIERDGWRGEVRPQDRDRARIRSRLREALSG
jgi:hypothetical protein